MKSILFIEEKGLWRQPVLKGLGEGFGVIQPSTLQSARDVLERKKFDIVMVEAPIESACAVNSFAQQNAAKLALTCLVYLAGKADIGELAAAFGAGFDDYFAWPMEPVELRLRLESRFRDRVARLGHDYLWSGKLRMAVPQQRVVHVHESFERDLELTPNEFRILYALATRERQTLSRDQILREAWGEGLHVESRTVDKHVCSLRRKLGDYARALVSVAGKGYLFDSRLVPNSNVSSNAKL